VGFGDNKLPGLIPDIDKLAAKKCIDQLMFSGKCI